MLLYTAWFFVEVIDVVCPDNCDIVIAGVVVPVPLPFSNAIPHVFIVPEVIFNVPEDVPTLIPLSYVVPLIVFVIVAPLIFNVPLS